MAVKRLYEVAGDPSLEPEYLALSESLNRVTRLPSDPAGGGEAPDEETAFRTFLKVLAPTLADFHDLAPVHSDIVAALLDPEERVLLLASRGSGKSTLTQAYAAHLLHRDPLAVVVVISSGEKLARRVLRTVRNFVANCPLLRPLVPDESCIDSADAFVTPAANGRLGASMSFSAFGVTSTFTGWRAKVIILDDIESRKDETAEAQEALDHRISECEHLLVPGGRVVALGTPQVSGRSIYARWAKSDHWVMHRAIIFDEVADGERGQTTLESRWPSRFSNAELAKRRRRMPKREFDLHWRIEMGELDEDGRPIKLHQFITLRHDPRAITFPTIIKPGGPRLAYLSTGVADADDGFAGPSYVSPDQSRYATSVCAIDPASGLAGRDELGLAIVSATTQGKGVIRCLTGVRGESAADTLQKAAAIVAQYGPDKVVIEARSESLFPAQLGAVLTSRGSPITIETVSSGMKKQDRIIDVLTPVLADRRLVLLESVVSADYAAETLKQLTHVARDARTLKHDDRVDALAWAVAAIAPSLSIQPEDHVQLHDRTELEKLAELPLIKGGIAGYEDLYLDDSGDEEERVRLKFENALAKLNEEHAVGKYDLAFAAYVEQLRLDVRRFRFGI